MNIELYENLEILTGPEDSPFYSRVRVCPYDGMQYKIYSYRLASYTEFLKPYALECRGHMFRMDVDDYPILVSAPFPKFFNLNENPFSEEDVFDWDNIDQIAVKEDGSLISTYLDYHGALRFKSKTSLDSVMAVEASHLIKSITSPLTDERLVDVCTVLENEGYTVIMEYVSPSNRIVIPYDKPNLVVLGARNRNTLEVMSYDDLVYAGLAPFYTAKNVVDEVKDAKSFAYSVGSMTDVEGYVIRFGDGKMVKLKTDDYVALHRAKEYITTPRHLFTAAIRGVTDDLRQLFETDEMALNEISNMEKYAHGVYNTIVGKVERYYENNKHLSRKDYAINGKSHFNDNFVFGLAMSVYSGHEVDFAERIVDKARMFINGYKTTLTFDNGED